MHPLHHILSLLLLLLLLHVRLATALCPNACSGHGSCSADNRCVCFSGWMATDCNQRSCPSSHIYASPPASSPAAATASSAADAAADAEADADAAYLAVDAVHTHRGTWDAWEDDIGDGLGSGGGAGGWSQDSASMDMPSSPPSVSDAADAYGDAYGDEDDDAVDEDDGGIRYLECGNRGVCDRKAGLCECFDGYSGAACDRQACP